jgi:hypothetical protein
MEEENQFSTFIKIARRKCDFQNLDLLRIMVLIKKLENKI